MSSHEVAPALRIPMYIDRVSALSAAIRCVEPGLCTSVVARMRLKSIAIDVSVGVRVRVCAEAMARPATWPFSAAAPTHCVMSMVYTAIAS